MINAGFCPYCGRPIEEWEEYSEDHVFVDSLGGHVKVAACKRCNNQLGTRVEGAPLRLGSFVRFARDLQKGQIELRGTFGADGHMVQATLRAGGADLFFEQPVTKTELGYRIRGTRAEVERHLRSIAAKLEMSEEQIAQALGSGQELDVGDGILRGVLEMSLNDHIRLAAKVSLGAMTVVDAAAVDSGLATELRRLLWESTDPKSEVEMTTGDAAQELVAAAAAVLPPGTSLPDVELNLAVPRAVITGMVGGRTMINVSVAGLALGFGGFVVNAASPFGFGLPVVVEDHAGQPIVRRMEAELLRVLPLPDLS
ncbi:MAG: HNH endonuclease [Ilumatobacteraceae bacterium]